MHFVRGSVNDHLRSMPLRLVKRNHRQPAQAILEYSTVEHDANAVLQLYTQEYADSACS